MDGRVGWKGWSPPRRRTVVREEGVLLDGGLPLLEAAAVGDLLKHLAQLRELLRQGVVRWLGERERLAVHLGVHLPCKGRARGGRRGGRRAEGCTAVYPRWASTGCGRVGSAKPAQPPDAALPTTVLKPLER